MRRGLALLEVMMALVLGGGLVLAVLALARETTRMGERFAAAQRNADEVGVGDHLLRLLLRHMRAEADSVNRFSGARTELRFWTLCPSAGGWASRCRVQVRLVPIGEDTAVLVDFGAFDTLTVSRIHGTARFRYLDVAVPQSAWSDAWGESAVPPGALAIAGDRDTLWFAAGGNR